MQVIDKEQQLKIKTQEAIRAVMREFSGGEGWHPPMAVIDYGVMAVLLMLDMSWGSFGNEGLYEGNRTYLLDEDTRVKINMIVDGLLG